MFKIYKQYKNGGKVLIHTEVDRKLSDFKTLLTISNLFAKEGKTVEITPRVHFKSDEYKEIYGSLIGTAYKRKCPDLQIDEMFYEYESFIPPFKKEKVSHMIKKGLQQSSRIIIDNNKGCNVRYILKNIHNRLRDKSFKLDINEVWLYEKGKVELIYEKNRGFYTPILVDKQ